MQEEGESKAAFVQHIPCGECGSKDNNALYDDGHSYCFGCNNHVQQPSENSVEAPKQKTNGQLLVGEYRPISKRKIDATTARKYGYHIAQINGQTVQVANYRNAKGQVVAQKIRTKDKKFKWLGDPKDVVLFGSHLLQANSKVVITEGEIDALSVNPLMKIYTALSLPNGAAAAKKSILKSWDALVACREVILMFDSDEKGVEAAEDVAAAMPLGSIKIAKLVGYKDANEALVAGDTKAIVDCIFSAKEWRPQGIVDTDDIRKIISQRSTVTSTPYPYPQLQEITKGIQKTSLITVGAGSGVGKTTLMSELVYHLHQAGETVGVFSLEETNVQHIQGLIGRHLELPIRIDEYLATEQQIEDTHDALFHTNKLVMFSDRESPTPDRIFSHIQYMALARGCTHIILDHISLVVSTAANETPNERVLIDHLMTELRSLCQQLKICIFVVSHLKRPQGALGHEDGAPMRLSELRGSHSLAQLADTVLGIQKDPEDSHSDRRQLVVLKNRFTGQTGLADELEYNRTTGRLTKVFTDDIPF